MELSATSSRVYEFAIARLSVDPAELATEFDLPVATAEKTCRELVAMNLLQPAAGQPGRLSAVHPLSASAQLLAPLHRGLAQHQQQVAQLRQTMDTLLALYANSSLHNSRLESVETLSSLEGVRSTLGELAAHCTLEVLTCQPGGGRATAVLEEAIVRDEAMLQRGVQMRTLYQKTALFSQSTIAYVERVADQGAQVRTSASPLIRLIAFDRSCAVISHQDDPMAAVIIRDPSVVQFAVSSFEHMWIDAEPFSVETSREKARAVTEKHQAVITRMLLDGATDEAIARDLGMSVRTCRRHISEIMKEIGAKSRMHAGYLFGLDSARTS
ncbi:MULTISPECIES: LuxR C-terminal-related transcriptional regulator [unclassified Streptomyces]|uniref:LuxR C-terminal-related transcriptional regulator n=1 Tax=unclassified Streptomyces TaxID=2593676 RepID=UPI002E2D8F1E|nr:LuxR C-terminal-related transcriptional regulator [Streptomyces sp. NBC_01429]